MPVRRVIATTVLMSSFIASSALAQSSSSPLTNQKSKQGAVSSSKASAKILAPETKKSWSAFLNARTDFYVDGSKNLYLSEYVLSYQATEHMSAYLYGALTGSTAYRSDSKPVMDDLSVGVNFSAPVKAISEKLSISAGPYVYVPISEASQKSNLKTAWALTSEIKWSETKFKISFINEAVYNVRPSQLRNEMVSPGAAESATASQTAAPADAAAPKEEKVLNVVTAHVVDTGYKLTDSFSLGSDFRYRTKTFRAPDFEEDLRFRTKFSYKWNSVLSTYLYGVSVGQVGGKVGLFESDSFGVNIGFTASI